MRWNSYIQSVAQLAFPRQGFFARFLWPAQETHDRLFGKYKFTMDLSLGRLQKIFFLKADDYEADTQAAFRKLIKPGMTVFDIGANSGYFTLLMADLVGPEGRVYSFEPFPVNFNLLKTNVLFNGLENVHLFQSALSDRRGEAILHINPVNDGGHSLGDFEDNPDLAGRDKKKLKELVRTETLDEFMAAQKIDHVDIMKVDVEGAETLVFAGAKKLLARRDAPILICEVGDIAQKQVGKTEKKLREELYAYGYRSYELTDPFEEFNKPIKGLMNVLFMKERT